MQHKRLQALRATTFIEDTFLTNEYFSAENLKMYRSKIIMKFFSLALNKIYYDAF